MFSSLVSAWTDASHRLSIRVIAPFTVSGAKTTVICVAFLPDFGGPQGMVIGVAEPPHFETDQALIRCAEASGMFYAFVNPQIWAEFDVEVFKDALEDWGYFGAPESRPIWLPGTS